MKKKYQALVAQHIPLTQAMGWKIERLQPWTIATRAPLKNNINIHQTGFAGSLYALAMATGWTLVQYWLDQNRLGNTLVAGEGNIRYLRPATGEIYCEACIEHAKGQLAEISSRLAQSRNGKLCQLVDVVSGGRKCAILEIKFVLLSQQDGAPI